VARQVITRVPGTVWKVLVAPGDQVKSGDLLFVIEVMKTEVPHHADGAGTVSAVHIREEQGVEVGMVAIDLE
jgi:biotin carboxyl carrier protein